MQNALILTALLLGASLPTQAADKRAPAVARASVATLATAPTAPCPPIGDCQRRLAPATATLPTPHTGANSFTTPGRPDLYVRPKFGSPQQVGLPAGFPGVGYCGPVGSNGGASAAIWLMVRNKGSAAAAASTLRVHFVQSGSTIDMPTPALQPGQQVQVGIPIPLGCFKGPSSNCNFTMTTDQHTTVAESNELNNSDASFCTSAAT